MLTINEEFINNIIFDSTLNKIQCEILKISYPLKNNWKDELINKEISMEDAELLILLIGNLTIKAQKQILKNFKELYKFKKFIKEGSISKDIISKDVINPVKIYCDGACKGNPGNSGSGLAIYQNNIVTLYTGLFMELGTNNIAELNALKKALEIAKNYNEVTIYSDSMYAIDCITKWAYTWEKNNWVKKGSEIKNLELIKDMFHLYNNIKNRVIIKHVKGHSGNEGNELADRMAVNAINSRIESFTRFEFKDINSILKMESF